MSYNNLRAIALALGHPIATARYVLISIREANIDKTSRICNLLNAPPDVVARLFQELDKSNLSAEIRSRTAYPKGFPLGGMTTRGRSPVLYVICRLTKPQTVLETGVASGVSSTYILHALNRNGRGALYSIDFPTSDRLPTGWLVPNYLRNCWQLILGKSSERLPVLLDELSEIDIFLHDSDHSYENMMFEFRTAWPYIRKGGLLLSDDTHLNNSFFDFANEVNRKPVRFYLLSAIRK